MENLATLLPWMVLFFLPLFFVRRDIWDWITAKESPVLDPHLRDKLALFRAAFRIDCRSFFLDPGRYLFCVLQLCGTLFPAYFSPPGQRRRSEVVYSDARSFFSRDSPFCGLHDSSIAFDWFSSPDYRWASTMWGVYIFAGAAGAGMAMIILVVMALKNAGYLQFVNEEHYHIMGKLLFVFSIFWGYIGFSQYMLIWYANIPEETEWFLRRNIESWNVLNTFLVIGRFFIPFFYLLFQYTKRTRKISRRQSRFGCWECIFWTLTSPSCRFCTRRGFELSILDLLSLLAIGCPLAFIFLRRLGGASLFPARDPRLLESLKLSN